jgi:hypothetical protein
MFFDEIKFGDKDPVQHVCFVVHGIGEACDTKFRPLIECVEDFRDTSRTILQSHFKTSLENGLIHRVVRNILTNTSSKIILIGINRRCSLNLLSAIVLY